MTSLPTGARMARYDALLRDARAVLEPGEAEILLAHASGRSATWLFAHGADEADAHCADAFAALVARRRGGEPVAYLTGRRGFWTLDLRVTCATLIPRPETERLVELALEKLPVDREPRLLDLGTGSGAIALALAAERPRARVLATDTSSTALDVARKNAAAAGLGNVGFRLGDWYDAAGDGPYDLIASNPPYIAEGDPHLARGDLRHEPMGALVSGADGLDAIRVIAAGAPTRLAPGGWLLIEHGWEQGAAVRALLEAAGLQDVVTDTDLEGRDRVSSGRRPG